MARAPKEVHEAFEQIRQHFNEQVGKVGLESSLFAEYVRHLGLVYMTSEHHLYDATVEGPAKEYKSTGLATLEFDAADGTHHTLKGPSVTLDIVFSVLVDYVRMKDAEFWVGRGRDVTIQHVSMQPKPPTE
jgi:hypothetical protein